MNVLLSLHYLAPSMAGRCTRDCDCGHHRSGLSWSSQWLHYQFEEIHSLLYISPVFHHPGGWTTEHTAAAAYSRRQ